MIETRARPLSKPKPAVETTRAKLDELNLLGLAVLFAPAGIGKTTTIVTAAGATGWTPYLCQEPREPLNADWPQLATPSEALDEANVPGKRFLLDSLRGVLFSGGAGATLKGGVSASALLWLTDFHNELVNTDRFCLATVNPVYEDPDMVAVVRNTIAGSVGALL